MKANYKILSYKEVEEKALKKYPFGEVLEDGTEVVNDSELKKQFDAYMRGWLECSIQWEKCKQIERDLAILSHMEKIHPNLIEYFHSIGEELKKLQKEG